MDTDALFVILFLLFLIFIGYAISYFFPAREAMDDLFGKSEIEPQVTSLPTFEINASGDYNCIFSQKCEYDATWQRITCGNWHVNCTEVSE